MKDLDRHITGDFGERQFEGVEEDETPDMEEERYANARKVSILELIDELKVRDGRISRLEMDLRTLRGFVAHALRMCGDVEDAQGLEEENRRSWPGRTIER